MSESQTESTNETPFVLLIGGPFDQEEIQWPAGRRICALNHVDGLQRYLREEEAARTATYLLVPHEADVELLVVDLDGPPPKQLFPTDTEDDLGLYGSDLLPPLVDIAPDVQLQLGSIVARAQREWLDSLGEPALLFPNREWNRIEAADREALLTLQVQKLIADPDSVRYSVDNLKKPAAAPPQGEPITAPPQADAATQTESQPITPVDAVAEVLADPHASAEDKLAAAELLEEATGAETGAQADNTGE